MTEEKIKADEVAPPGTTRIAELERENEKLRRENRALLGKKKMLTTSTITAPAMASPRPSIMISTTIRKPHPIGGKPPMLQTHGLPKPKSAEDLTSEILTRVKGDRISVVTKKEKP